MKRPLMVLFLLLGSSDGWAQTVKLPLELKGDPGVLVVLKAETDCASLQWLALDPGLSLIPPELLRDTKTAVVLAAKAGKYRVMAYGAKGDVPTPPAVCQVVIGNPPAPGPAPPPAPTPTPTPVPLGGVLHLTVVQDQAQGNPKLAEVLRSPSLRTSLEKAGHRLLLYDQDSKVLDDHGFRPLVTKVGLPCLIVQDAQGVLVKALICPDSEEAFLAVLK